MNELFQIIGLFIIALLAVSNIRYLHSLILNISGLFKQIIQVVIKLNTVTKQVQYNYEAIIKLNKDMKIDGRRISSYVEELHCQNLMNTARIRILLDKYHIGLFECDSKGECVWVNRALCELYGMEEFDMMGHGWLTAVLEEQRSIVLQEWINSIKNDMPYSWGYNIINQQTGENVRVRATALTVRDDDRKPLLFCGSVERA